MYISSTILSPSIAPAFYLPAPSTALRSCLLSSCPIYRPLLLPFFLLLLCYLSPLSFFLFISASPTSIVRLLVNHLSLATCNRLLIQSVPSPTPPICYLHVRPVSSRNLCSQYHLRCRWLPLPSTAASRNTGRHTQRECT